MKPRWKIRRVRFSRFSKARMAIPIDFEFRWFLYLDDEPVTAYFVWENAILHVDNWFYEQTLRSEP